MIQCNLDLAAGSASVCISALCMNEMCFCWCLSVYVCVCVGLQHIHISWTPFTVFVCWIAAGIQELWWHNMRGIVRVWHRSANCVVLSFWAYGQEAVGWRAILVSLYPVSKAQFKDQHTTKWKKQKIYSSSLMLQKHARWCRLLLWAENEPGWKSLFLRTCRKKG